MKCKFSQPGQVLTGIYAGTTEDLYGTVHKIDVGNVRNFVGNYSLLAPLLKDVHIGDRISITFEGAKPSASNVNRSVFHFKVEKGV